MNKRMKPSHHLEDLLAFGRVLKVHLVDDFSLGALCGEMTPAALPQEDLKPKQRSGIFLFSFRSKVVIQSYGAKKWSN